MTGIVWGEATRPEASPFGVLMHDSHSSFGARFALPFGVSPNSSTFGAVLIRDCHTVLLRATFAEARSMRAHSKDSFVRNEPATFLRQQNRHSRACPENLFYEVDSRTYAFRERHKCAFIAEKVRGKSDKAPQKAVYAPRKPRAKRKFHYRTDSMSEAARFTLARKPCEFGRSLRELREFATQTSCRLLRTLKNIADLYVKDIATDSLIFTKTEVI